MILLSTAIAKYSKQPKNVHASRDKLLTWDSKAVESSMLQKVFSCLIYMYQCEFSYTVRVKSVSGSYH